LRFSENWINIDNDFKIRMSRNPVLRYAAKFLVATRLVKIDYNFLMPKVPPNYLLLNMAKQNLPFDTSSIKYCFTSHFIEHVPRVRAEEIARETHRVLKPGGVLRVVTPDLEVYTKNYLLSKKGDKKAREFWSKTYTECKTPAEKINALFARPANPEERYLGFKNPVSRYLKQSLASDLNHQWIYDFDDLRALLAGVGFRNIKRWQAQKGTVPDIGQLEIAGEESSIYLEAEK
jgi:SAM-dependent methyltransferase